MQRDERCSPMSLLPLASETPVPEGTSAPRILLAATLRWPVAARLAMAFRRVGCHVEAVCPKDHPFDRLRASLPSHRYSSMHPQESLIDAIGAAVPDLIIPCDDGAASYLHLLWERMSGEGDANGAYAALIERSLGSPSACALASARGDMADLAMCEGLREPTTQVIASEAELNECMLRRDFPLVLKVDNTWGGLGVRIVHNMDEAQRAFRILASGPSLAKAMVRTALDRDPSLLLRWRRHVTRVVTIQNFVRGVSANRAVACWKGQVLAGISVEALNTGTPTGPATVVKIIEHAEMSDTAARLVRRLGLSGLWGFDFVLDAQARAAWLIEVNPRATPICHLSLGKGNDLPAALCAQLTRRPIELSETSIGATVIALFPGEWHRDSTSQALHVAHHDVPWEEPGLVDESIGPSWEERGLLARLKRRLRPRRPHKTPNYDAQAYDQNPYASGPQS